MTFKTLFASAALAMATAAPVAAVPIDLHFSFGGVTGTFYGLDNAVAGSSASSVDVVGLRDTYLGIATTGATYNSFEFVGGQITSFEFQIYPAAPGTPSPGVLDRFDLFSSSSRPSQISESAYSSAGGILWYEAITFTQTPPSSVPLPAGAWLLLSGLGGIAALKRWKKQTA